MGRPTVRRQGHHSIRLKLHLCSLWRLSARLPDHGWSYSGEGGGASPGTLQLGKTSTEARWLVYYKNHSGIILARAFASSAAGIFFLWPILEVVACLETGLQHLWCFVFFPRRFWHSWERVGLILDLQGKSDSTATVVSLIHPANKQLTSVTEN